MTHPSPREPVTILPREDRGPSVLQMSAAQLRRRAQIESQRFHRDEPVDDRFALELFRRAVVHVDDTCWQEVVGLYERQVVAWGRRAGGASIESDDLTGLVWERFWRNYTTEKLAGVTSTASVLSYLKLCVQSVVIDLRRRSLVALPAGQAEVQQTAIGPSLLETCVDDIAREELWRLVSRHLETERAALLVHLRFVLGLRPGDIVARHPETFRSVTEVYRQLRNLMNRLKRDPELRAWMDDQGG